MTINYNKGFTLLELLVVISIIGILSSVVLVSYKGHTARARLANTMQYAKSVNSLLGAYTVGAWGFDNISGETVYDDSANGNNGTIYGAVQDDGGVIGKAMKFDGVDGYVDVGNSTIFNIANMMTIGAWVKPISPGSLSNIIFKGNSIILAGFSGSTVYFYLGGVGNWAATIPSNNLYNGNWHYVTYTYDKDSGTNNMKFFIDGILKLQTTYMGSVTINGSNLMIGKSTNYRFNGIIDDVQIYSTVLPVVVIQQHYAKGLKIHQNLAIK